ncbi:hypothetical protein MACH09_46030 [Vibrio sp. MACH09]|uniref:JAB domain-containing protein n=1 Tax=Vibrio sp. MACH09 TaxID=3025122 RepID=UPI00278E4B3A|nr:JAB domain-containing protein [Vibrio sp. MACH09]GLO64095.1 hypothetical protein MACH09_46030 [Vibrio sp. MACH09]
MQYKSTYGQGTFKKLKDTSGQYYQLTKPITPDELLDVAREIANDSLNCGIALTSSTKTKLTLATLIRDIEREVFGVLFLNNQNQLIKFEVLFYGTVNSASVYPREVIKRALIWNASAVMFCHNHPSGSSVPSEADKRITRHLSEALALIDIQVLDHFVIGNDTYSFAEHGLI